MAHSGSIQSSEDYKDTPSDQYKRWSLELSTSQDNLREYHKSANKVVKRFLDDRDTKGTEFFRLNLFHSSVTTLRSMLFGKTPRIDVSRRYADANDDVARVSAVILQRLLNNDVEEQGDAFNCVLRQSLDDRLIPGLGLARVRYELQTETEEIDPMLDADGFILAEGYEQEVVTHEEAVVDYVHWRDVLFPYARTYADLRWLAYRSYLSKDEVTERWDETVAGQLSYKVRTFGDTNSKVDDKDNTYKDSWQKAEVWEIWDKDAREVVWVSIGHDQVLETLEDTLELENFFPSPPGMLANVTTSLYLPKPDYILAQDIYNEIDKLQTRISVITDAVKVIGVYDKSAKGLQRMFKEGVDNDLIPVENWAQFAEKGGLSGTIDWFPINDVTSGLDKLRDMRDEQIKLLHQITGMSDILRGAEGSANRVSATESSLKAQFGSVRIQALQDEFSIFASSLAALKAEVICKHFSPETIISQANLEFTVDAKFAQPAVELLKQQYERKWRVIIRPETVAMVDHNALKNDRSEFITSLATFMQSAAPLVQFAPQAAPTLMELLKWGLSGFKGSQEIEGVIDKAVEDMRNAPPGGDKEDDGKEKAAQAIEQQKQKAVLAIEQQKHQHKLKEEAQDHQFDTVEAEKAHQYKMTEMAADHEANVIEKSVETETNLEQEVGKTALAEYLDEVKADNAAKLDTGPKN